MNEQQKAILAVELDSMQNNQVIKDFVEAEAYGKIASDISALPDRVCTEKAARLIVDNVSNPEIRQRWLKYVSVGYAAVMMVKYQQAA